MVGRGRALDRGDEARDVAMHAGWVVRLRNCEWENGSNTFGFVTGDGHDDETCAAEAAANAARSENAMRKRRGNGQRRKG